MYAVESYKELIVWQKSIHLVKEIFLLTNTFPKVEIYGLISQMKRAAISIPSNIAGGYGRNSRKEYSHALAIAYGSSLELETQLVIAKDLHFGSHATYKQVEQLLEEVIRMLYVMRLKLKTEP